MMNVIKNINKKSLILFVILSLLIGGVFFSFPVIASPDSAFYYWYSSIFDGSIPFSSWNITRGPIMGLVLFFSRLISEKFGFKIILFIFYMISLFFCLKIINNIKYKNILIKRVITLLFIVLIIFNPLIIGYYHLMLTEFFATTLAIIICYFAIKFFYLDLDEKNFKKRYLCYSLLFMIIGVVLWFLKQPYISICLFFVGTSVVLSIIRYPKLSNVLYRMGTILIVVIGLVISIKSWDAILLHNKVNIDVNNSSGSFIADGIVNGITNFHKIQPIEKQDVNFINNLSISESEKVEILNVMSNNSEYEDYDIYEILNMKNDEVVAHVVLFKRAENLSLKESVSFYLKHFKKFPLLFFEGYCSNYLAIINVFSTGALKYDLSGDYYPIKQISNSSFENNSIGLAIFNSEQKILWRNSIIDRVEYKINNFFEVYDGKNNTESFLTTVFRKISLCYLNLFKILFFIAPFISVFSLIKFIKFRRDELLSRYYGAVVIIFSSGTLSVLFYAFFGALIDRYVFPLYPCLIIGLLLILKNFKLEKDLKKNNFTSKLQLVDKNL